MFTWPSVGVVCGVFVSYFSSVWFESTFATKNVSTPRDGGLMLKEACSMVLANCRGCISIVVVLIRDTLLLLFGDLREEHS